MSRASSHFLLSRTRPSRRVTAMFLIYGRGATRNCCCLKPHNYASALVLIGSVILAQYHILTHPRCASSCCALTYGIIFVAIIDSCFLHARSAHRTKQKVRKSRHLRSNLFRDSIIKAQCPAARKACHSPRIQVHVRGRAKTLIMWQVEPRRRRQT